MIEKVETQELKLNLNINGEGKGVPSPPPSSEIKSDKTETHGSEVKVKRETLELNGNKGSKEKVDNTFDLSEKELEKTIEKLNEKLNSLNRELLIKVDKKINKNYISIVDKKTKEVIKEYPPKEIRKFIAQLMEFDEKIFKKSKSKNLILNIEV